MADKLQIYKAGRALLEFLEQPRTAKLGPGQPLTKDICKLAAAVADEARATAGVLTEQQTNATTGTAASGAADPLAGAAAVLTGCSLLAPRGKYDMAWFASHLLLHSKSGGRIEVPYSAVEHIVILEKLPREAGDKPCLMLVLDRASQVFHGKNRLNLILIQTNSKVEVEIPAPPACAHLGDVLSGAQLVVLCQLAGSMIEDANDGMFLGTDASIFSSVRGDFAVQCNIKAKDGYLFPLESALAYVGSPSLFVRHVEIQAVELARATPSSSTFDLTLHLQNSPPVELGQIDKSELARIQGYLTDRRLPLGTTEAGDGAGSSKRKRITPQPVAGTSGQASAPVADDAAQPRQGDAGNAEDSDEDDSDFDPTEKAAPAAKRRKADNEDVVSEDIGSEDDDDEEGEDEYESSDDGDVELVDEDDVDDDEEEDE